MKDKDKKIENTIIDAYIKYVLDHGKRPKSIHSFTSELNLDEPKFYEHFSSFDSLEKEIFALFSKHTITTLSKSKDYETFDSRNKLLSFYYTFFENLKANRSFVIYLLGDYKSQLKNLKTLSGLRTSFLDYVETLNIETFDFKQEKIEKAQKRIIGESAWFQLLITLKFWLEDHSKGFEKTDIFIEKMLNTSFDVVSNSSLKSIVDFGKFLYKEKMQMN